MSDANNNEGDLRYMQTQVWDEHFSNGATRAIFSSLYARDGARSYRDATTALLCESARAFDLVIDALLGFEAQADRFFLDLLLPASAHLGDWKENDGAIFELIHELGWAESVLARTIYQDDSSVPPARDGAGEAEVSQRLAAYRAVRAMVSGRGRLADELEAVSAACKANLSRLLSSEDAPDDYLSTCHSMGGDLACGDGYWLEPLLIVADAARATDYGHELAAAVDEVAAHLGTLETGHEGVRWKIGDGLARLRRGLL